VAAQVIGSSGSDLSRVVYIDKGEDVGVRRDMPVITAEGIVGKVLMVYPSVSQVLLINDQSSGVGAILEKSRLQGVLRGGANGEVMLERVMSDEQVAAGDVVLTSGGDQIFPKGLPVGTVSKVSNGRDLFLNIKIKPAANLSKLEEVLVLVEKQERQAIAEDKRVRAADILAQRLPSVPEKPPEGHGAGAAAGGAPQVAGQTAATGSVTKPKSAASLSNPNVPTVKTPLGGAPAALATPPTAKTAVTIPKPKTAVASTNMSKPESTQPAIVEEKPAVPPTPQPNPQPPADDSQPH
jgi:rod shape-determining protein MreC